MKDKQNNIVSFYGADGRIGHYDTHLAKTTAYVKDYLGNTRIALTSADPANPVENVYDYLPYGDILKTHQTGQTNEKYLSTEHERDPSTGLDYRLARYSDPIVGRFLSVDPLAHKFPHMSPYAAFNNNPIFFTDPTGMAPEPPEWWTNGVAKWNRLNNAEKNIIRWDVRFYKANDIEKNADAASAMTEATFGKQGKGDESDAFRHAFWQATNTQDVGESFTRKWSDAHEYGTPTNEVKTDLYMDIHNNDVGIEIGKANPKATPE